MSFNLRVHSNPDECFRVLTIDWKNFEVIGHWNCLGADIFDEFDSPYQTCQEQEKYHQGKNICIWKAAREDPWKEIDFKEYRHDLWVVGILSEDSTWKQHVATVVEAVEKVMKTQKNEFAFLRIQPGMLKPSRITAYLAGQVKKPEHQLPRGAEVKQHRKDDRTP